MTKGTKSETPDWSFQTFGFVSDFAGVVRSMTARLLSAKNSLRALHDLCVWVSDADLRQLISLDFQLEPEDL